MDNLMPYQLDDDSSVHVIFEEDTVWISQKEMARLFDVQQPAISKHLKSVYDEGELDKNSTHSVLELVQTEGERKTKRSVEHYNLDAIISVGYRVSILSHNDVVISESGYSDVETSNHLRVVPWYKRITAGVIPWQAA